MNEIIERNITENSWYFYWVLSILFFCGIIFSLYKKQRIRSSDFSYSGSLRSEANIIFYGFFMLIFYILALSFCSLFALNFFLPQFFDKNSFNVFFYIFIIILGLAKLKYIIICTLMHIQHFYESIVNIIHQKLRFWCNYTIYALILLLFLDFFSVKIFHFETETSSLFNQINKWTTMFFCFILIGIPIVHNWYLIFNNSSNRFLSKNLSKVILFFFLSETTLICSLIYLLLFELSTISEFSKSMLNLF